MALKFVRGLPLALIIVWELFMIIGWIFIVAALARQEWVVGSEPNRHVEVGLFRQCEDVNGQGEDCSHVDINIDTWKAAAAFFIVGIIVLTVVIVLGFVSLCKFDPFLMITKILLSFANLCFMIAIFLIPIGFAFLDDKCPKSNNDQCGLVCDGDGDMDFFKLCSPYEVGAALWVLVVGLILLFIGSWFIACVQTKTVYTTYYN
eukprot:m.19738 g.19738  ORF g.19738 m.19738 type:complete len:204 (+) comp10419_c0_seq1:199-810(+)